jgi:hypothetical protein
MDLIGTLAGIAILVLIGNPREQGHSDYRPNGGMNYWWNSPKLFERILVLQSLPTG